ncbi:MAG: stage II sporulation protein M [Pseudomonadota bacterium]
MKQEAFEQRHRALWERFEKATGTLNSNDRKLRRKQENQSLWQTFDQTYRQVCQHLALARARRYSLELQQRLNQLALDGHRHLYAEKTPLLRVFLQFLVHDFPATVRRYWRPIAIASALFYLPGIGIALAIQFQPDLIYHLMSPMQVAQFEYMYDPDRRILGRDRGSPDDLMMFGYYIYNNVSIGFQTYAGGVAFGLGTLFYVIYNGLYIGAVAGHLQRIGYGEPFWSFVSGHSALELTAIVLFGGIGLALGWKLINPGDKRRWHALRDEARATLPVVYGGAVMLVFAAFVEAYWSSTTSVPVLGKYAVGIVMWLFTLMYFTLAGRRR